VYFQFIDHTEPFWNGLAAGITAMIAEHRRGWLVQKLNGSHPALIDGDRALVCGGTYSIPDSLFAEGSVLDNDLFSMPLSVGERVILFGGGHCALALAPLLHSVGFRVTVMDNRAEFVTRERYPMAEERICGDYNRIADHLTIEPEDYIVVMTSGHSFDYEVQEQVLRFPSSYVGVIGSRRKTASVNARLRNAGVPEDAIQSVHTPIGLNIKAVTPEEIAVSITAEMILVRAELHEKLSEASHSCPMH
ncbi:MAG: XdhC family protein, partial [Mogibacterium sp.]|nr:XdhC family protein [Mogibacterium sp.]